MTDLEKIRLNIGDELQSSVMVELAMPSQTAFPLKIKGVNSVTYVKKNGVLLNSTEYSLASTRDMVVLSTPCVIDDEIEIAFIYAGLTDDELTEALIMNGNDVIKASIIAIGWLLASSAKLYNYSTGKETMNQQQVFENLTKLKAKLEQDLVGNIGVVKKVDIVNNLPGKPYSDISRLINY